VIDYDNQLTRLVTVSTVADAAAAIPTLLLKAPSVESSAGRLWIAAR
jgi:hypothetical protein